MAEEQQKTRSGKHREARRFDQTQLKEKQLADAIHRDYAAHFFRWGWVARHLTPGCRVLDVGCGQDLPLWKVLAGPHTFNKVQPAEYVGVELNPLPKIPTSRWARFIEGTSFVDEWRQKQFASKLEVLELGGGHFTHAVNLEVIEHMGVEDGLKLLKGIFYWLAPGGRLYLSTPVFDGTAARNHVHEYTIPELESQLKRAGFQVERRFGTFASKPQLKKAMKEGMKYDASNGGDARKGYHAALCTAYTALLDFYGDDVMSTFLAPLYPDASRNNLWVCVKR